MCGKGTATVLSLLVQFLVWSMELRLVHPKPGLYTEPLMASPSPHGRAEGTSAVGSQSLPTEHSRHPLSLIHPALPS